MANAYSQIYVHLVFVVKYRDALLRPEIQPFVFGLLGNLFNENHCKTIAVNGVEDHVHALVSMKPLIALSDLTRIVKARSSKFINDRGLTPQRFEWQPGYGSFSIGYRDRDNVIHYIRNQHQRHLRQTFLDEYIELLTENGILFSPEYLFTEPV
jgi:REP element-mobilizing transposase RayT